MNDVLQYRNFIESLKSRKTKKLYDFELRQFIQYIKGEEHLISDYPKLIETQIIDYICHLKSKGLSQSKLSLALCAISHFYTMNDILLNKKKITKFMNNNDDTVPNKAYNKNNAGYTTEQILKLLDFCDDRIRLIILLFASSGIRLAGLSGLKIRNLSKIKNENIYQITVYQGSKEEYVTFCTPECTKAIDSYLSYRVRSGEKLDPNSALIRDQFNADDLIRVKNPKVVTTSTIGKTIDTKLRQAGLRQIEHATENKYASQLRKTIPMIHGFRKFFNTALMNSDVHPSFKKLLMGHSVQLDEIYYDKNSLKSQTKLLEEYSKAIDYLTINEENRLRKKVEVLKAKRDEIEMLKGQVQQRDDRLSVIEKQMQSLVSNLSKLTEQGQVNTVAQNLYSSGILKEGNNTVK